jgi:hypothetical protein
MQPTITEVFVESHCIIMYIGAANLWSEEEDQWPIEHGVAKLKFGTADWIFSPDPSGFQMV